MIEALERTKPWVRFLSVIGFISVGLMALGAVVLGAAVAFSDRPGELPKWLAVLYAVLAVVYFFGVRLLHRYATAIDVVINGRPTASDVEDALWAQQAFWRFAGILTIIMLGCYAIMIPVAIALAPRPAAQGSSTSEPSPLSLMFSTTEKQKKTMADMRAIAFALEARATDTNEYPPAMPIEELAKLLEPTYSRQIPRLDAWGNALVYESVKGQEYYVASAGRNGVLERPSPSAYAQSASATQDPDEDIVFANGSFLRYPEAAVPVRTETPQRGRSQGF